MKNVRRGLGKGLGTGYKNLAPMDSHIHSLSAKGVKTNSMLNDALKRVEIVRNSLYKKKMNKMAEELNQAHSSLQQGMEEEEITIEAKGKDVVCWNCGEKVSKNKVGNYFCPKCHLMIKYNPDSAWGEEAHKLDKYGNLKAKGKKSLYAKKTFKIGESAKGGVISVETSKTKATIIGRDWDFSKGSSRGSSQSNAPEWTRLTVDVNDSDAERKLQNFLEDITTPYYADNVMDFVKKNVTFNSRGW